MTTQPDLDVTFIDHLRPRATAGQYHVETSHVLSYPGPDAPGELAKTTTSFEVRAPQFVLDESSVHAIYPARGADGDFATVLPHITLSRAVLPWERETEWSRDTRRSPWMALLVLKAGELPDDPEALGLTVERVVADLCDPPEPGVAGPDIFDLPDSALAGKCQTIDVPVEVFLGVLPHEDELYYLAHVRDVQPRQTRADGEVLVEGKFSVVTANRFPRATGDYAVHLVSLEGCKEWLHGTAPVACDHVRLAALWSWSFRNDETAAFDASGILANLIEPGESEPENLALRLAPQTAPPSSPSDAEQHAIERLRLGYVPVPYRMLSGEQTYAWYRGPGTPLTAQPVPLAETDPDGAGHTTADHALIYDEHHGLFDVSYASAWTLGRTIGIADPGYAGDTVKARRSLANTAVSMMAMSASPSRADGRSAEDVGPTGSRGLGALRAIAQDRGGRRLVQALAAPQVLDDPAPRVTGQRLSRAQARATLAEARGQTILRAAADVLTGSAPTLIDRLTLLHGVPFSYLVPDPRMLPEESLRMFRIDPNWIDALISGVCDVALSTSLDLQLAPVLSAAVRGRGSGSTPAAGLLIYSEIVVAWPDIIVLAELDKSSVTVLRRDRLARDVLLVLFDRVPDEVVLREPGQGIHFGLDDGDAIKLRELSENGPVPLGATIVPPRWFPGPAGSGAGSVVSNHLRPAWDGGEPDVLALLGDRGMVPALSGEFRAPDLTPSQVAVQMVNAPLELRLTVRS